MITTLVATVSFSFVAIIGLTLRFANKIEQRAFEDLKASEDREAEFERHKMLQELLKDPPRCRALRESIQKQRDIVEARKAIFKAYWDAGHTSPNRITGKNQNWEGMTSCDDALKELAKEEGKIPLFDEKSV